MKTELLDLLQADIYTDAPEYADRVKRIQALVAEEVKRDHEQEGEAMDLYRARAKELHVKEGTLEIDPGAIVSISDDGGAYVAAWLWVEDGDVDGLCRECGALANDGEGYDGLCGNCADKAEVDHDKTKKQAKA